MVEANDMTAPYKKRALAGWNHDKKQSNKDERKIEPKEVAEQLNETVKPQGKRTKKNSKEKKVQAMCRAVKWALKRGDGRVDSLKFKALREDGWFRSHYERMYQDCKNKLPQLKEMVDDQELSSKVRRQIREILDSVEGQVW
jgi:hypothetical protein